VAEFEQLSENAAATTSGQGNQDLSVFIFRRFLTLIATLVGASLIIFLVLDALPGNAAQMLMGADASPDAVRALMVKLGLDQPLHYRYVHWIKGLLTGDLGNSYAYGTPVAALIAERLTLTIPLAIMSMSMTVVLALSAGIYTAANHNKLGDVGVMSLTQFGIDERRQFLERGFVAMAPRSEPSGDIFLLGGAHASCRL